MRAEASPVQIPELPHHGSGESGARVVAKETSASIAGPAGLVSGGRPSPSLVKRSPQKSVLVVSSKITLASHP